ncbi:MAG: nuclear transport factor 2 family protein [Bacteroidota bacterium]
MKLILSFMVVLSLTGYSQSSKDSSDIRLAVTNYADGWYEGDTLKMTKAIHPRMTKRIVGWSREFKNNQNVLQELNAFQLMDGTQKGIGKRIPAERRLKNVTILSMYTNTVSVKLEMADWFEYLHLGRWNGEWKIINSLWEMKPQE